MTKRQFDRLQVGDSVWTFFSNSYRRGVVVAKESRHATVRARGNAGRTIERRCRYQSINLTQLYGSGPAWREEQQKWVEGPEGE